MNTKCNCLSVWNVKKRSIPFISVIYIWYGGVTCSAKNLDVKDILGLAKAYAPKGQKTGLFR